MNKYFEINENGHNIRCKLYYDKGQEIRKVIVWCHGFAGHMDGTAAEKFAEKLLTKYKGIATVAFNLPCHGNDVKKKLILEDCLTYLGLVTDHVRKQFQTDEIYAYATSFGGYLVLKYIADKGNPFRKIALRCPAVNMHEIISGTLMTAGDHEKIKKNRNVTVGFDRKIEINPQFLEDLKNADIQETDYLDWAEDILILHGTKDELVPFEKSASFADRNIIEFVSVEGADHRFQNPLHMEAATKAVIGFFGF